VSGFNKHQFSPTDGFLNESAYPNPETGEENRQQHFSLHAQTRDFVNGHIDELASTVAGADGKSSGADKIGSAEIANLPDPDAPASPALSVRAQIRSLAAEFAEVSGGLAVEGEARANADAALREDLETESQNRAAADTALLESISTESQARAAADASLSKEIAGKAPVRHDSENTTYGPADTRRYGHMRFATDAEVSAGTETERAVTPKQLKAGLAAEAKAREAADGALRTDIEAEADARRNADIAEAGIRAAADISIRGDVSAVRADLETILSLFGTKRTWQEVSEKYPTWADVKAAGSWLKVQMKAL
jgi:hypothetical protein